jgi:ParB-like chromosome segregation protein Spo0J
MLKEIPLSLIDPNPFRDFTLFPIDQDQIDRIVNSIEESGFWTGLRGRLKPGSKDRVELAYGHHRLVAANKAKRATLSIDITSISDDEMVFLLTAENAVQRADHAAASLDAVAAICRRIIYHLMGGGLGTLRPETPRWAENGHQFLRSRDLAGAGDQERHRRPQGKRSVHPDH